MSELHVVLGATGGAGSNILAVLEQQGREVLAVSRSGTAPALTPDVAVVTADVEDPEAAKQAVAEAAVVYMAARPPYNDWPGRFPAMLDNVINATGAADAKLVLVDNLYMYGPGVHHLRDDSPQDPPGHKGQTRKQMSDMLARAHSSGRVRMTMGRMSDYYGPNGDAAAVSAMLLGPALEGKAMRWASPGDVPHSTHYMPDCAHAYVQLADSDRADGEAWILPAAPPVTGRELMDIVNRSIAKPVKTSLISPVAFTIGAWFSKMLREVRETGYQFSEPWIVDGSRFSQEVGPMDLTPHDVAIPETLEWYRTAGRVPKPGL